MKSENTATGKDREAKPATHSNNYNNEISSGNVGSESGFDNGASTLRALHKKYADNPTVKKPRKPIL